MFDSTAEFIWTAQYAQQGKTETIAEGLKRASSVTSNPVTRLRILSMMLNKAFCPGGRILAGAGTVHKNVLNCFRAGTLVHTENGAVPMETLVGQTVNVLSSGGVYRPATFKNYGKQELMKVTLANGEVIYATPEHDWIVVPQSSGVIVKTHQLEGKRIPQVVGVQGEMLVERVEPTPFVEDVFCCEEPETHTIVVGGGYLTRQCFVISPETDTFTTLDDVRDMALKNALITKVGGGTGENLDTFPSKEDAVRPEPAEVYAYIAPDHADHARFYAWEYRDISMTKGKEWLSPPRRAVKLATGNESAERVVVGDSMADIVTAMFTVIELATEGKAVLVDFSGLRAEGSAIAGSGGTSSGASSFAIELLDNFVHWYNLGGVSAGPVAYLRYIAAPLKRVVRQGGCMAPDTLVQTSEGLLSLAELIGDTAPLQETAVQELQVSTDEGARQVEAVWNNGVAQTLTVKLENGQSLTATPNHKVKVLLSTGERVWKRLDQLQEGEFLIQRMGGHQGKPVALPPTPVAPSRRESVIQTPAFLDAELAYGLGYLWGNGFVSGNRIGFSAPSGAVVIPVMRRLFESFGLDLREEPDGNSSVYVTRSVLLTQWLKEAGLLKAKAADLRLPRAVRQSPPEVLAAFIGGYFEADGAICEGTASASSVSYGLLSDIQTALAGLSIPSKLREVKPGAGHLGSRPIYSLRVHSPEAAMRWCDTVPMAVGSRFHVLHAAMRDTTRSSAWPLPHAAFLAQQRLVGTTAGKKGQPSDDTKLRKNLKRFIRGERQLTASAAVEMQMPGDHYAEYYWRVESVEQSGQMETLDLCVADNHTYLAAGFVTHNTRRGAGMATLTISHPDWADFLNSKDLEREAEEGDISTYNISFLIPDTFIANARKPWTEEAQRMQAVAKHAWKTGEPGLIFEDTVNRNNLLLSSHGPIKATNPLNLAA